MIPFKFFDKNKRSDIVILIFLQNLPANVTVKCRGRSIILPNRSDRLTDHRQGVTF